MKKIVVTIFGLCILGCLPEITPQIPLQQKLQGSWFLAEYRYKSPNEIEFGPPADVICNNVVYEFLDTMLVIHYRNMCRNDIPETAQVYTWKVIITKEYPIMIIGSTQHEILLHDSVQMVLREPIGSITLRTFKRIK